jgi:hypothetical protein
MSDAPSGQSGFAVIQKRALPSKLKQTLMPDGDAWSSRNPLNHVKFSTARIFAKGRSAADLAPALRRKQLVGLTNAPQWTLASHFCAIKPGLMRRGVKALSMS